MHRDVEEHKDFKNPEKITEKINDSEIRTYDSKTGAEVKRHLESSSSVNHFIKMNTSGTYTVCREGTAGNSMGIANINNKVTNVSGAKYIDLTSLPGDIGSLDVCDEHSIFDKFHIRAGSTNGIHIQYSELLTEEDKSNLENSEDLKKRLEEKLLQSGIHNTIESENFKSI